MKGFDTRLLKIEENGHTLSFYPMAFSKLAEQIFLYFLGIVNSFMLSGYSAEAVTASNISTQIITLAVVLFTMAITGAVIHLSISLGRQDRDRANLICSTAFYAILAVSLIVAAVIIIFSRGLLGIMNVEDYMLGMSMSYLRVVAAFLPVKIIMSYLNNLLICNGYATLSLLVGVVTSITNAVLCYVVLYTHVPLPVDKITAVAFANGIASSSGMVLSVLLFKTKKCPFGSKFSITTLKEILKMGIPGGMNGFSYTLSRTITTAFVALLGVAVFNTKVYVGSLITFAYCLSASIGSAGGVFTGRYNGRKDFDAINSLYKRNIKLAIFCNITISLLLYVFHKPLIGIFTTDAYTIKIAGQIMLLDVVVEAVRAINNVSDQALNANGDVKTTLMASVLACWLCSVLMSYVLGIKLGLGLVGMWLAFLMDESLKAIIYIIRWKSEKWKYLRI